MARLKLADLQNIEDGVTTGVRVYGKDYLITRQAAEYFVLDGRCSHRGGILKDGDIEGDVVRCPKHGARFDLRSGKLEGQVKIPLIGKASDIRRYTVEIIGDELFIEI